jgi:hypothetical protein
VKQRAGKYEDKGFNIHQLTGGSCRVSLLKDK